MSRWKAIAAAVCATSWAAAVAAVVLQGVHRTAPPSMAYWISDVLSAVVYGAVTLVMLPRSRHPVAWIMVLVALGSAATALATQYYLLSAEVTWLPGADQIVVTGGWVWIPGTYASVAILPWIVTVRRPPGVRVLVALAATATAAAVLRPATLDYKDVVNLTAIDDATWQKLVRQVELWPDRLCVILALAGAAWLAWLRLRANGDEGRGLGWLVLGQLFLALALVPTVFVRMGPEASELSGILVIFGQAFLPVALLVVVLGQQLWGVDAAVSRVTVWSLLTGTLLLAYGALAWVVAQVVPDSRGLAGFLAVGLVVALGQPLRHWIQERVDKLVYGQGADPVQLLGTLGRDLGEHEGTRLDALVDALREGLRLGAVEVRSVDGEIKARAGRQHDPDLVLPLTVEGRRLGDLRVSAPTGERIDPRTMRLVGQMVGVLAVALELAQVNERLAATSGRLVEVRHEERRMLRRDLHDGMGPALAGVGLGLAAAQRRLTHDPEGTAALLAELEAEVERRTEDVRLLARALLPVQLDDGDLCRALDVLADRFRTSGLIVETRCGEVTSLETRRQIGIYHVAAEALMNAYRHARATTVGIEVIAVEGGPLVLEVVDDGRGLADNRGHGIGLRSMQERCVELGGDLTIAPRLDGPGTLVRMVLP